MKIPESHWISGESSHRAVSYSDVLCPEEVENSNKKGQQIAEIHCPVGVLGMEPRRLELLTPCMPCGTQLSQ